MNSLLTADDLHLFNEGTHLRMYNKLGCHLTSMDGADGAYFAVWAPNAAEVSVIGDFNGWEKTRNRLSLRADSGIWEGFLPEVTQGACYKFHLVSRHHGYRADKTDPYDNKFQTAPERAAIVWKLDYQWGDGDWMATRHSRNSLTSPISIYEVHAGSWRRVPEEGNRPLTYREMAVPLAEHVSHMGFTHVEFLPVMEHPSYGSWGYQTTGYFAPASRYGTPQDFMWLIDYLHQRGIGVILDWVPSHFPNDEHGLGYFDGTHLYEHSDPRQGVHRGWDTFVFNYARNEVRTFLESSAMFWLDKYHIDGLRVDAVASMLYLDYGRRDGEWIPNAFGGRENLDAVAFLRTLNEKIYQEYPDVQTIAEESTAWPMVSRPTYTGGLGFGMKWDLGWMHDTLEYMSKVPLFRKHHHDQLTFRGMYAFSENFVLPLPHDEVVYGKGSLLSKMPGDDWQKFANLRLLLGYMYAIPGKKLLFMGGEFGQWNEWYHESSLDWHLLEDDRHRKLQNWVRELNLFYRGEPAMHLFDLEPQSFEWVEVHDSENSVIAFLRRGRSAGENILVACNFTPVTRHNYRIGVPEKGFWSEHLNSDAVEHGGSGQGNLGGVNTVPVPVHDHPQSLTLTLPPLGVLFLRYSLLSQDKAGLK